MAYSIDAITDGCYPGTTCLINKLGIQDESVLAETEAAVVLGKASLLDQQPIQGEFVSPDEIESCAGACFKRLSTFHPDGLSHRQLAEEVADFYHTINMLHPFREGNGRTQRLFFAQWIQHLGYEFALADVDPDTFMIATIYAAQGVMDQLIDFFEDAIQIPHMSMEIDLS